MNDINKIKSLDILDVAHKLGIEIPSYRHKIRCVCEGHEDKNPSMSFHNRSQTWKCFSCGKSGDSISLVQEVNRCSFPDAILWFSKQYGWDYSLTKNINYRKIDKTIIRKKEERKNPEFEIRSDIYQWIIDNTSLTANATNFLFETRMLSPSIIEKLNIKSIDNMNSFRAKALKEWGEEALNKSGFGKGIGYAWYCKPIIFPYYNLEGKIIQLQARATLPVDSRKRYSNLKGIETCMYNMPILNSLHFDERLYIFEGVTDCLSALSLNLNAIAIPGVPAYKENYIEFLKPFNVVMVPDQDIYGQNLFNRINKSFNKISLNMSMIKLPEGFKDFSDYYVEKNKG